MNYMAVITSVYISSLTSGRRGCDFKSLKFKYDTGINLLRIILKGLSEISDATWCHQDSMSERKHKNIKYKQLQLYVMCHMFLCLILACNLIQFLFIYGMRQDNSILLIFRIVIKMIVCHIVHIHNVVQRVKCVWPIL